MTSTSASILLIAFAVLFVGFDAHARSTLLTIEPSAQQPRNSEGDVVELNDGRLCLIYTRFTGGAGDAAAADLAMRTSSDRGKTWGPDEIVVARESGENVMSVSLLRLDDGRIALFYLEKLSIEDCRPVVRFSDDECGSFSEPTVCIDDEVGYYVLNNDRAVQLQSGRLILPVAQHNRPGQEKPDWAGRLMSYQSDDRGATWRRSTTTLTAHRPNGDRVTVQEPGIVELKDGRLMMYGRTDAGSQYVAYSSDDGDTWTRLEPSALQSPRSPATIEREPWTGNLICVWNDHSGEHAYEEGRRTPLCVAVSRDDGLSWQRSQVIESDPRGWYCYTAMTFLSDQMLLTFCAGDDDVGGLNRLKMISLTKGDVAALAATGATGLRTEPLLPQCLDYGRSFVNTRAAWNSPRFWVESRCRVENAKSGRSVEYLQCGSCKAERTFATRDLFFDDNYDFLPVFSEQEGVIFRRRVHTGEPLRDVRPVEQWWGGVDLDVRRVQGRVLTTPDEILQAMQDGKPIIGQSRITHEPTGHVATIEFPIKTINFERDRRDWQVDTGPVLLPDLSVPPDKWSTTLQLAYIAFRSPGWADFLVNQPTPVPSSQQSAAGNRDADGQSTPHTYHYARQVHHASNNVLLALDKLQ